ncbi:helix-turn-helix domain-containing protein [Corynebacterium auriscanis]|uniref:helix-turn-helix domain-containing protein n=1 Tax=Corynebacterium auriscanis TaxID=99807 RepID=UPI003CFB11B8
MSTFRGSGPVYIKFCLDQSYSIRQTARQLGRHPSVISREVTRNSIDGVYHPLIAQQRSIDAAKRPKPRKLDANTTLRRIVIRLLKPAGLTETYRS